MQRRSYPSDLSEQEWAILEPLIPPAKPGGHPRTTDMREVINAILYLETWPQNAGSPALSMIQGGVHPRNFY